MAYREFVSCEDLIKTHYSIQIITLMVALLASPLAAAESEDISKLRKQVVDLSQQQTRLLHHNEVLSNHRLATYQARLLIKTLSYETCLYLRKQGVHRNVEDIENIMSASYACSWNFASFGKDHLERFINIIQWPRDETGFQSKMVCHWKAGTYLQHLNKYVMSDTNDYGAFQVNEQHIKSLRHLDKLYNAGIISLKVKGVHKAKDLLDTNTNCVARCVIEADRVQRGWEWQNIGDKKFRKMILSKIENLEDQHLYNRHFVEKYYYLTPVKKYRSANFEF